MNPIQNFRQLTSYLKSLNHRKRVAVVCPHDPHTEYAVKRALEEGFAEFLLVADKRYVHRAEVIRDEYPSFVKVYEADNMDVAARKAVELIRSGEADVLMKGIINTDNLLKAVLDKEKGLLPKGRVLTHITLAQIPAYPKFIFFSDSAVIPRPTYEQFGAMILYAVSVCHHCGLEEPRVALIHCSEKVNEKFPHTLDYVKLKADAVDGVFGQMQLDGPMDVKTACDLHSGDIKGLSSPVVGNADVLIFPNIESGNTFYKAVSLFARADMAGILQGTVCPVVVTSRSDSSISKYYSLALACITEK
jgi:phosphate butyryltransferase